MHHRGLYLGMLGLSLLLTVGRCGAQGGPVVEECRQDLAKRLGVDVAAVTVEQTETGTWRDGSLGLARPGMMYTMALVPGLRLELKAPRGRYYYHVGRNSFRYAGRAELWASSAAYVEPTPEEPNGNGMLWQVSLLGTNPVLLLEGVTEGAPQADGSVLATRRTSRSSFDLLYLAPGEAGEARVLAKAAEFAAPVLAPEGEQYAVFVRPQAGEAWGVQRGPLAGELTALPPLPVAGRPERLIWEENRPLVALTRTEEGVHRLVLMTKDGAESWEDTGLLPDLPPSLAVMIGKSCSLIIDTETGGDPPRSVTRVYEEVFLADPQEIAVLDNFALTRAEVTPDLQFALLTGQRDEKQLTLTVDLRTGENWETLPPTPAFVRLLARPSHWDDPLKDD